jgi:hypothetical protein
MFPSNLLSLLRVDGANRAISVFCNIEREQECIWVLLTHEIHGNVCMHVLRMRMRKCACTHAVHSTLNNHELEHSDVRSKSGKSCNLI